MFLQPIWPLSIKQCDKTSHPLGWLLSKTKQKNNHNNKKNPENKKCWRGCGEIGILVHCWWEYKMVQLLWKTVWQIYKKLTIELARPNNATPVSIPQITENRFSSKCLYTNVHNSIICNSQKVETTQMSINRWMNKQNVVYPYIEYYIQP